MRAYFRFQFFTKFENDKNSTSYETVKFVKLKMMENIKITNSFMKLFFVIAILSLDKEAIYCGHKYISAAYIH